MKPNGDDALARRVREARMALLFRHAPFILMTTLFSSAVLAGVVAIEGHLPQLALPWWLGIALFAAVRVAVVRAYYRSNGDPKVPWHRIMTVTSGLSGLVWGSAGVLFFFPDAPAVLTFTTIFLAGMAAGSSSSLSAYMPAQYAYAIPTMLPLALRYLVEGGWYAVTGIIALVFLGNILAFARNISESVVSSIRLRFENLELVERLREEKAYAEEQHQKAEAASQAKTRFLAAASHDLRQPLHAVNLFIEALRNERDPERCRAIVEHLRGSADAFESLLNELLDISKLEAGLFKPEVRSFPLQTLFDALDREFRPLAEEKGIEIGFVPTRAVVASDPGMLGRMVRNVLANALRYTGHGAVLVGCRRRAGRLAIAVYDTGPGIAPEHHKEIFREFHQLGNPERDRRKGLGLGLAIVEGLGRLLGERIELKSVPGRGSVFFITVARGDAAAAAVPVEAPADVDSLGGLTVLAVDDEPAILTALRPVLEGWGCRVFTAESAEDALAQLDAAGAAPDVMVVDFRLREGRTGGEAIVQLRGRFGPVPAAVLTGDTAPERLREAGSGGYLLLHKPLQAARLKAALVALVHENLRSPPHA